MVRVTQTRNSINLTQSVGIEYLSANIGDVSMFFIFPAFAHADWFKISQFDSRDLFQRTIAYYVNCQLQQATRLYLSGMLGHTEWTHVKGSRVISLSRRRQNSLRSVSPPLMPLWMDTLTVTSETRQSNCHNPMYS